MEYTVALTVDIPDDEISEKELAILEYHFLETMKEAGIMEETTEE